MSRGGGGKQDKVRERRTEKGMQCGEGGEEKSVDSRDCDLFQFWAWGIPH